MSKKELGVILVLSVVVTYVIAVIDALMRNSLLVGSAGLPFKFASGYLGSSNTNDLMFILNIVFWFLVIFGIWKILQKIFAKKINKQ